MNPGSIEYYIVLISIQYAIWIFVFTLFFNILPRRNIKWFAPKPRPMRQVIVESSIGFILYLILNYFILHNF